MGNSLSFIGKDDYVKMMSGYVQTAKGVLQLAVGSLVLPIFFLRQIVGIEPKDSLSPFINKYLISSWGLLLLSIGFGVLYQSLASKRIEKKLKNAMLKDSPIPPLIYNFMFITFFAGIVLFLWWAKDTLSR